MKKAYSLLQVKSVDAEQRIIKGIASTPTPDRSDDIVDPQGAKFALPIPFLWHHLRLLWFFGIISSSSCQQVSLGECGSTRNTENGFLISG